jgi:hypothetical protein
MNYRIKNTKDINEKIICLLISSQNNLQSANIKNNTMYIRQAHQNIKKLHLESRTIYKTHPWSRTGSQLGLF